MAKRRTKPTAPVEKDRAAEHAMMAYRRAWAGQVQGFEYCAAKALALDREIEEEEEHGDDRRQRLPLRFPVQLTSPLMQNQSTPFIRR